MMVETILECPQDFGMSAGALPQWKRELLQRRAARGRPPTAPPAPPASPPGNAAPAPRVLRPDEDEELRYGPGIVNRLKSRYLSLALRDAPRRRPSVLRRAASLEHLLDEPAPAPRAPRPASLAAPPPAAPERRESVKRARSVDALSRLEAHEPRAPSPPRAPCPRVARPPRRPQPLLREAERPPPDVVRAALRKFEAAPARRPPVRFARTSTPEPRGRSPSPAATDATGADEAAATRPVSRAALDGIARAGCTVRYSFEAARRGSHLPPLAATNPVLRARLSTSPRRVGVIRPMPPAPASPPPLPASRPPSETSTELDGVLFDAIDLKYETRFELTADSPLKPAVSPRPDILPKPIQKIPKPAELMTPPIDVPKSAEVKPFAEFDPKPVIVKSPELNLSFFPDLKSVSSPELELKSFPEDEISASPEIPTKPCVEIELKPSPEVLQKPFPEIILKASPELTRKSFSEVTLKSSPEVPNKPFGDVILKPTEVNQKPCPDLILRPTPEIILKPVPETILRPSSETNGKSEPNLKPILEINLKHVPEINAKHSPEVNGKPFPEVILKPISELNLKHVPELASKTSPEVNAKPFPEVHLKPVPETNQKPIVEVNVKPSEVLKPVNGHAEPERRGSPAGRLGGAAIERGWNGELKKSMPVSEVKEERGVSAWGPRVGGGARNSPAANSVVFNFSSRKEVPDYIENDGIILRGSRRKPQFKAGEPGVVVLHPSRSDSDSESETDAGPPSPCGVRFVNDNVLINGRSSIAGSGCKRDRLAKLKLQFDESLTRTHQYPSETSLCEERDELAPSRSHSPPRAHVVSLTDNTHIVSASLSSYTPHKTRDAPPALGLARLAPPAPAVCTESLQSEESPSETDAESRCGADVPRAWSQARQHHTDLLF